MAAIIKTKLKNARDAISKKQFATAKDLSLGVLEYDPENYNANVFLGLAYLNLGEHAQSEQAYRRAIDSNPTQVLAWQGIVRLYKDTESWPEYLKALEDLARLYAAANDATKCAEALQAILERRRSEGGGTPLELAEALSLFLPGSPFYDVLSALPPPDYTNPAATSTFIAQASIHNSLPILEELVAIYEKEEDTKAKIEIEKRRTRLGAPPLEQLRKDVALEIVSVSKLPHLYNEVINHPSTSDELRRATESKLLHLKQRHLFALPVDAEQKVQLAAELDELVNGIVLLKIPNALAWSLALEKKDAASIEDYDYGVLHQYMQLLPDMPLARMIEAYFGYMGIVLEEDDDEEPARSKPAEEDVYDHVEIMMDVFSNLNDSILAHRIIAELYEQDADCENAMKVAQSGLELVRRVEQNWGRSLKRVRKAFNITLATSLVHYYPPKHHIRALKIIDELLADDPENIPSLMGKGFILQHAKKWSDASAFFNKASQLDPNGFELGIRAKEEHAWCEAMRGNLRVAAEELQSVIDVLDGLEGREDDKARSWWRLGRCDWEMGDDHKEEAYKRFITALKRSSTFAPAFTSLGIYYADFLSPPDPDRASKCFQKAFELDPREGDAARRLAEGFAEEGEWDLVDVVARRTIEGEGGLEDGPEVKASRRYLPLNAWAWKALGAVELNRRNYIPAIEALQIALRTDVGDYMSWLRLGEAYSKAGRYAAAFKALEHARELNPRDWVASYFIGDVQRQMGLYEEAIKAFETILQARPQELGVLQSLGQTFLELGQFELSTGFSARAEASFVSAVRVSLKLIDASSGFRRIPWKMIADALIHLSTFFVYSDEDDVQTVALHVLPLVANHPSTGLAGIVSSPLTMEEAPSLPLFVLQVAITAYDYRLTLGGIDDAVKGTTHFDLGSALSAFARRTLDDKKRELAEAEAITQFKNALRLEPTNDSFWLALGNATFLSQPSLCQHSYIRALEIDNKNAASWTNLGMFYLAHDDVELANEAFLKAQTLDSDYALAWVGQGLAATANGHDREANALFEHATGLTSVVPEADLEHATRLFRRANAATTSRAASADALLPAFFVLDRYCRTRPQDAGALHLFGLVCERVGHVELGIDVLARAIAVLEAAYEETEDPAIERRFATAHVNIARLRLAVEDFAGALESYEVATGLLPEQPEEGEGASEAEARSETRALLAQCQFGSGLANFKLGQLPEALALFEAAMATAGDDAAIRGHVVVLVAQTLWAIGSDEAKESAKSQLLQSIEYDPENLMAINTLAGMGILTDDDGLVDAALSELLTLSIDQRHERDPERDVTYLLVQHHLGQGDTSQALSVSQKAVFAEPDRPDVRRKLASLALQKGEGATALAILGGSSYAGADFTQLRSLLGLHAVALCLEADTNTMAEAQRLAQKGVMLFPWNKRSWETLAYVRSRAVTL